MEMDLVAVAVVVVVVVMSKNTQRVKQELVCIMRRTLYVLFYFNCLQINFFQNQPQDIWVDFSQHGPFP